MRMNRSYGVHKYADGGKVELNKKAKKGDKKKKPTPEMLGSGAAKKAGETLRDRRQKQMDDLGLKDGGKVKKPMKPPEKGGKPKRIGEGMNDPGGPYTPGAKAKRKKQK